MGDGNMHSPEDALRARLDPYIQTLGLRWPLSVVINNAVGGACALLTFPLHNKHTFCIHPKIAGDYQAHAVVLTRALCRARLAELLDPMFTSVVWGPQRSSVSLNADEVELTHVVTHILGVWACDLRHELWPDLSVEEMAYYGQHTARKDRAEINQVLETNTNFVLEIAEIMALAHRHVYDARALEPMIAMIDLPQKVLLEYLSDFFVALPRLDRANLSTALHQLEKAAGELVKLLSHEFAPTIHKREYYFWTVDSPPVKP